jgi:hypothetical protein
MGEFVGGRLNVSRPDVRCTQLNYTYYCSGDWNVAHFYVSISSGTADLAAEYGRTGYNNRKLISYVMSDYCYWYGRVCYILTVHYFF